MLVTRIPWKELIDNPVPEELWSQCEWEGMLKCLVIIGDNPNLHEMTLRFDGKNWMQDEDDRASHIIPEYMKVTHYAIPNEITRGEE